MNCTFAPTRSMPSQPFSDLPESHQQDQTTIRSVLLVAATGLGKTCIFAGLARSWPQGRIMVISHRFELNMQAIRQLEAWTGLDVDLEQAAYMADQRSSPHPIVVASVQTLNSSRSGRLRMCRFKPDEFGLLVIDEAHHATAPTYRRVVDYFRQNPDLVVVGLTATPDRLDRVGLVGPGRLFDAIGCDFNLLWGIDNGYLVRPVQKFVRCAGLDLRDVRTVAGDLDGDGLRRAVEQEEVLHQMARPIVEVAGVERQGIVFAASVQQAHRLAEMLRDYSDRIYGPTGRTVAVAVDGSTGPQDPRRIQVLREFKAGQIQHLVNVGVATEGFDAPAVSLIAIGRPTKSRALYTQMLGRGSRPIVGDLPSTLSDRLEAIKTSVKPSFTVLDFVGQAGRHKLVCAIDAIFGDTLPAKVVNQMRHKMSSKSYDKDVIEARQELLQQERVRREARRAKVTVGVDYKLVDVGPYNAKDIPRVHVPWMLRHIKPTEKQRNFLVRLGYTPDLINRMNTRQASAAIKDAIDNPRNGFARWVQQKRKEEASGEAD